MKKPNGSELLELLVSLYAEQEGVQITYEFETIEGRKTK